MNAGTSRPVGSRVRAPSASMAARRVADGSTTKTSSTPLPRNANHSPMPIGPAPNTIAVPSGSGSPSVAAWYATDIGSTSAPSSSDTLSGSRCSMSVGTTVYSAMPPSDISPWKPICAQML